MTTLCWHEWAFIVSFLSFSSSHLPLSLLPLFLLTYPFLLSSPTPPLPPLSSPFPSSLPPLSDPDSTTIPAQAWHCPLWPQTRERPPNIGEWHASGKALRLWLCKDHWRKILQKVGCRYSSLPWWVFGQTLGYASCRSEYEHWYDISTLMFVCVSICE